MYRCPIGYCRTLTSPLERAWLSTPINSSTLYVPNKKTLTLFIEFIVSFYYSNRKEILGIIPYNKISSFTIPRIDPFG